jgi:hypothetical protein
MDTLGAHEVALVQRRNRIPVRGYDRFIAAGYYTWLQTRSARLCQRLPQGPEVFRHRVAANY